MGEGRYPCGELYSHSGYVNTESLIELAMDSPIAVPARWWVQLRASAATMAT